MTEDVPFDWLDRVPPFMLPRLKAKRRLLPCCRERGLTGLAPCIANTYGPRDYQPTPHNGQLWQVASSRARVAVDVAQPTVDIRDAAEAALLAETRGASGKRYIIAKAFVGARLLSAEGRATRTADPLAHPLPSSIYRCLDGGARRAAAAPATCMLTTAAIYLANVFRALHAGKAHR